MLSNFGKEVQKLANFCSFGFLNEKNVVLLILQSIELTKASGCFVTYFTVNLFKGFSV